MPSIVLSEDQILSLLSNGYVNIQFAFYPEEISPPQTENPIGKIGSWLWVKEAFCASLYGDIPTIDYKATPDVAFSKKITTANEFLAWEAIELNGYDWMPAEEMPWFASRISVEITGESVRQVRFHKDVPKIKLWEVRLHINSFVSPNGELPW